MLPAEGEGGSPWLFVCVPQCPLPGEGGSGASSGLLFLPPLAAPASGGGGGVSLPSCTSQASTRVAGKRGVPSARTSCSQSCCCAAASRLSLSRLHAGGASSTSSRRPARLSRRVTRSKPSSEQRLRGVVMPAAGEGSPLRTGRLGREHVGAREGESAPESREPCALPLGHPEQACSAVLG